MLRQFTQNLHAQTDYQQLVTQVLLPGSRKDVSNIPSDTNPVEVKLTLRRNQLSIHAHFLPVEGTLLRIHLNGDKNLWLLWDKVRDELEKLGWFTLPEIQDPAIPVETKLGPQQIETSTPIDFWMMIPNIGANRDIVRLWHQSLTCGQIATRVGLTKKTILNRINSLRKEYGIQIVPYRKSNFIKKPKDIHD